MANFSRPRSATVRALDDAVIYEIDGRQPGPPLVARGELIERARGGLMRPLSAWSR